MESDIDPKPIEKDPEEITSSRSSLDLGDVALALVAEQHREVEAEGKKMLRSWKDVARRARIFEYCHVENPNVPTREPSENEESREQNGIIDSNEQGILEEVRPRGRSQSVTNPFNFPQKPIEQIEMLKNEVDLERLAQNEVQHAKRSPKHSLRKQPPDLPMAILEETENDIFVEEEEEKDMKIIAPHFQRLSLMGDNVSGVRYVEFFILLYFCLG